MLRMDYPSIRGGGLPDYDKKATWNLLNAYIYSNIKILIYEYPGDGVQSISRLQYQCANMAFSDQSRYSRLFQRVISKGRESEINYIKRFHNAKALAISVVNSYLEYQLIQTFLDNFQQGGK